MIKRIIVPVVGLAIAGGSYFLNGDVRDCNSLIDTANAATDAYNSSSTDNTTVIAKLTSTAIELREDAGEFDAPFDANARKSADDMDKLAAALKSGDEKLLMAAESALNADVDKTNADCKATG